LGGVVGWISGRRVMERVRVGIVVDMGDYRRERGYVGVVYRIAM
jgi:hypothetical protein